jgi:sulfur-oxidizing protein SoxZ
MQNLNPRIRLPRDIRKGEVFEVRTLVSHIMESGQRTDSAGNRVPRHIVNRLVCLYNGEEVFRADLHPGIAMDPYLGFRVRARDPGELTLVWTDDHGDSHTETVPLTVG